MTSVAAQLLRTSGEVTNTEKSADHFPQGAARRYPLGCRSLFLAACPDPLAVGRGPKAPGTDFLTFLLTRPHQPWWPKAAGGLGRSWNRFFRIRLGARPRWRLVAAALPAPLQVCGGGRHPGGPPAAPNPLDDQEGLQAIAGDLGVPPAPDGMPATPLLGTVGRTRRPVLMAARRPGVTGRVARNRWRPPWRRTRALTPAQAHTSTAAPENKARHPRAGGRGHRTARQFSQRAVRNTGAGLPLVSSTIPLV